MGDVYGFCGQLCRCWVCHCLYLMLHVKYTQIESANVKLHNTIQYCMAWSMCSTLNFLVQIMGGYVLAVR